MPGRSREYQGRVPEFYMSPRVKGLQIDADVRAAFENLWPWFWRYVGEKLNDSGRAGDLADEIAYRISNHLEVHREPVRSMVGLCRVAAMHFVIATKMREKKIEFWGLSHDIEINLGASAPHWQQEVEVWIWIDQLLNGEDMQIRIMLHLRLLEETWGSIGKFLRLTPGQARLRFKRAVERISERNGLQRPDRGGR